MAKAWRYGCGFLHTPLLIMTLILVMIQVSCISKVEGAKKVRVPDNLDDVVDDEEDEEWKAWGKPKPKEPPPFDPPPDLSNMPPDQIQAEMLKRHFGPSMGFVKLKLDVPRTREETLQIAKKWTKVLRTGAINAKLVVVDGSTIMFNIEDGQDTLEFKDFILNQPEAYEFKIGQQAYRRPGDPPLEVVVEKLRKEREQKASSAKSTFKDEF